MWVLVIIGMNLFGAPIESAIPREFKTKAACEEYKKALGKYNSVCVEK